MGVEEEKEFIRLLEQKRHKELIAVMTKILTKLESSKPTENIEGLLTNIANKKDDTMPKAIVAISKLVVNKLEDLKTAYNSKPNEWNFQVIRDDEGCINSVRVKGVKTKTNGKKG